MMNERISALVDGELDESELAQELVRLGSNADLRHSWDTYHLIGDTLRGHLASAVAPTVAQRLAAEPTVLAPQARRRAPRWKIAQLAYSAAASVAGVALVAWLALPGLTTDPQQAAAPATSGVPPIASVPAATPAAVDVDNYLLAHQSFSPKGAMQGVAPYVRTVADERGTRGK
jgi:sigma-E factor negative regulatory protein RseA